MKTVVNFSRFKNKIISKLITRFPSLAKGFIESYRPWETEGIPWTPVTKPLEGCKIAVVTTAGVHHRDQKPFDMEDQNGDPTFREIDITRPMRDLMITHDYYDHGDADRDINIVFPIERLGELEREKIIGHLAGTHYGFMGHIDKAHILTLISDSAPEVAKRLKADRVDMVLLVPG
ncbi:MAG: hypothetical protein HY730_09575 [Candidatus Tectomicrobia bacterium]|uniref:Selenoprotein B glycine/betaine/sarcosine/D-proline reductase n=1 Tax=Tectimicrobiota bacterium TaxID=2528274 RepID=A0A933GNY7_UNCTE|nr:hypothetical protein [Candidatus Tectomicrobia bacterium]